MTEYLLRQDSARELEWSRLALLEEYHDPMSLRQLEAIGVGEGWRCLDVGAGGGSVTRMLAERVGATGSVLAVDLDTTLLEPLRGERVEVRRHDLRVDRLPEAAFDLVHARLLLMHLPARLETLRHLAAAARPGGWVAAVDPDFTSVSVSPAEPAWDRAWSAYCDALVAGGWDLRYGARLCGDLAAAGLAEIHAEHMAGRAPGGTLFPRLLSLTFERLRERMLALGADGADIDAARRLLEDPARTVTSPTTCFAWARRPVA